MGQPTPRDGDLEPHFNTFSYFRKTPCLMLPRVCDDDIRLMMMTLGSINWRNYEN